MELNIPGVKFYDGLHKVAIMGGDAKACGKLADMLDKADYGVSIVAKPPKGLKDLGGMPPALLVYHEEEPKPLAAMCVKLRQEPGFEDLPLLALCAKAGPGEVAQVLDAGADDCLARPFSPELFQARVRAMLRRLKKPGESAASTRLVFGPIEMNLLERTAVIDAAMKDLTRLEFDLLSFLVARPNQAIPRQEILEAVWKYPGDVETRTLDKHVESLRKKVAPRDAMIQTVRGLGYRLALTD